MIRQAVVLSILAGPACADVLLTDAEIAATLAHGPWPQHSEPDPSNRFSGDPAAIDLGRALFFDPILSADGTMSCATCHDPTKGFSDGQARTVVRGTSLDRNAPSVENLVFSRWFGWGGDTDNLWAQSMTPITSAHEMGHTPDSLRLALQDSAYADAFAPFPSAEAVLVGVGKALAAYQETLVTGETPFDRFRDALAAGDTKAAGAYPDAAQRGLQIFLGEGNCTFCHSGPLFTNGEFHDAGVPYFLGAGQVDEGRYGGLTALLDSPYTLAGTWSDDPDRSGAWAVNTVRRLHSDFGTFKVPGLRNVAKTAPYMHDGSLPDLAAVVAHYNTIDLERMHADGEAILKPLNLTQAEMADLTAFLRSLSDTAPQ